MDQKIGRAVQEEQGRNENVSSQNMADVPWHAISTDDVIAKCSTDIVNGLNADEITKRQAEFGPNQLQLAETTRWYKVLGRQFIDVLIGILLVSAVISVIAGDWTDAVAILAIIVLNGLLGFAQEWKAEKAIAALRKMLTPHCQVIREGREQDIEASQLVPGDVVVLKLGDRVPADLRLVDVQNLKIDESALTGESESVLKRTDAVAEECPLAERASMAWMGTSVTNGRARGIVVSTGVSTQFGRIAELTQQMGPETTPLQRKLAVIGRQLGILAVMISILVAFVGWLTGKQAIEMLMTGISLAVAMVPEGLPAVVTITLALGIRAMVRRKALLRRLQAAEALGAATVICTDKTGTLTQNQMTVQRIWLPSGEVTVTGVGYDPAGHFEIAGEKIVASTHEDLLGFLRTGLLCNHAKILRDDSSVWHELGEPTEAALVVAAYKAHIDPDETTNRFSEFPFNSTRKRMTVIERVEDGLLAHTKGAPEVILSRCSHWRVGDEERELTEEDRTLIQQATREMAQSGLRTLALAHRKLPASCPIDEDVVEQELTFLGIAGIIDPPRPEVPQAMELAHRAGIRVIMITGDSADTALAIAQRIGLRASRAITGTELDSMENDALMQLLRGDIVFARTTPEQKLRIVELLQQQGEIVGMTGDGVNDAPALKKADIGIAMGIRGTDVSKEAADIVLTDDNFSSIINAVEEGRRQFDNIQKFVRYLLSSNTGEVLAIFLNIILGGPLILLPVQILWMNLVTDGLTAIALGMEPVEKNVMDRPPRDPKRPILDGPAIAMILSLGSYVGLATLLLFQFFLGQPGISNALAQTIAFTGIIIVEKVNVFNFRALRTPMSRVGFFTNRWILLAVAGTIGLQVCAVYVPFLQNLLKTVPLSARDWGVIILASLPIFVFSEIWKYWRFRDPKPNH